MSEVAPADGPALGALVHVAVFICDDATSASPSLRLGARSRLGRMRRRLPSFAWPNPHRSAWLWIPHSTKLNLLIVAHAVKILFSRTADLNDRHVGTGDSSARASVFPV